MPPSTSRSTRRTPTPAPRRPTPKTATSRSRIVVTNAVNTALLGTYTVTYAVSDLSGNAAAPVTRTVNVQPQPRPTKAAAARSESARSPCCSRPSCHDWPYIRLHAGHHADSFFGSGLLCRDVLEERLAEVVLELEQELVVLLADVFRELAPSSHGMSHAIVHGFE